MPAPPLYTIGYGSRTLDEFVAALRAHQLDYVIDVRSAPYSRFKPEFSRATLEAALRRHGVRYVFMGDLLGGQPNDPDCYLEGKVDYDQVRTRPYFLAGLQKLKVAWDQRLRAVLMCSEERPEQCHRVKLIGEALTRIAIPIAHIDETGHTRSQLEVIARLTGGQLDLFGSPAFTSRKRYPSGHSGLDPAHE
jgi:uncharacterized protein (DUF488 family)